MLNNYYSLRSISASVYEVTKWEEHRSIPLNTYEIQWRKGVLSAHMCSCPARVPCRHLKMLKDAIERKLDLKYWIAQDTRDGYEWIEVQDQKVCVFEELIEV